MSLEDWLADRRIARAQAGLERRLQPRPPSSAVIDLAGNDYLGLSRHPRVVTAVDAPELWQRVASRLTPDAVILLKGSRGTRLERLIALMEGNAARHPAAPSDQH